MSVGGGQRETEVPAGKVQDRGMVAEAVALECSILDQDKVWETNDFSNSVCPLLHHLKQS